MGLVCAASTSQNQFSKMLFGGLNIGYFGRDVNMYKCREAH